jgi:hippurate hydrolase
MLNRILIAVLVLTSGSLAQDFDRRINQLASQESDSLVELYKYLHSHPELSYQEEGTAAKLVSELKPLGFDITTGVAGHGFVGVMKNGSGPTVLVRTDLDGLPVLEKTGRPYASDVRAVDDWGNDVAVMQACGHDVHMTSFIGAARLLTQMKDAWAGTLIMIGQPAEERGTGARMMLEEGLFTKWPRPDYALAIHTDAALQAGKIGYHAGYAMANVDTVDIVIPGVSGHGAYPHKTKDPIVIAAQVILALQTIVSRELRPIDPGVVTVGSIHAGTKHNIISDEAKLQLTVRSYSEESRELILDAIRRITIGTARAAGIPPDKEPTITLANEEYTPAVYNDPDLVNRMLPVWKGLLGESNVVERDPEMGGEDFGRLGRETPRTPIFLFRVGTVAKEQMAASLKPGGPPLPSLHSSSYAPEPRPSVETGSKAMTAAVLELMKR